MPSEPTLTDFLLVFNRPENGGHMLDSDIFHGLDSGSSDYQLRYQPYCNALFLWKGSPAGRSGSFPHAALRLNRPPTVWINVEDGLGIAGALAREWLAYYYRNPEDPSQGYDPTFPHSEFPYLTSSQGHRSDEI